MWQRMRRSAKEERPGYLGQVPGKVKRMSVVQHQELSALARTHNFGAVGRPEWIAAHGGTVEHIVVMPIAVKRGDDYPTCIRCIAGVISTEVGLVAFTLDVLPDRFHQLPDIDDIWDLAMLLLPSAPYLHGDGVHADRTILRSEP